MVTAERDYLTPAQTAHVLGVTTPRVRQLVLEGTLPALMTPLGRLFDVQDVDALVRERAARRAEKEATRDSSP